MEEETQVVNMTPIYEKMERDRAEAVIEKAQRNGWNVIESMTTHMISRTLIEELVGEVPTLEKKSRSKSNSLHDWVKTNAGRDFSTGDLISELSVSYDTVLKTVKENPLFFTKVGRGRYAVRDGITEREEAKKAVK